MRFPPTPRPIARYGAVIAAAGAIALLAGCGEDQVAERPAPTPAPNPAAGDPSTSPPSDPPSDPPRSEPDDGREAARAELAAARERWDAAGATAYRWSYVPVCFCAQEVVTVEVIDGRVVGGADDGRSDSVEGWFDIIEEAIDAAAAVDAEFDPTTGVPVSVFIDVDERTADEEFGMEHRDLVPEPDPIEAFLVDEYGCGYGFAVASPDQTVSLVVGFAGFGGEVRSGTSDLADAEYGAIRLGADLMANWCDDVVEPGEPEPVVDDRWDLVGGTIEITLTSEHTATGVLRDVVARTGDGREIRLGGATVANDAWGFFAG